MAVVRSIGLAIVPRHHGALIAQLKTGRSLRGDRACSCNLGRGENSELELIRFLLNYALLFEICNL